MSMCTHCRQPVGRTAKTCSNCGTSFAAASLRDPDRVTEPAAVLHVGLSKIKLIDGETVLLGRRSPVTEIANTLNDYDEVSREHAEITLLGRSVEVRDLKSTQGTSVNGVRVELQPLVFELPAYILLAEVCSLTVELVR